VTSPRAPTPPGVQAGDGAGSSKEPTEGKRAKGESLYYCSNS